MKENGNFKSWVQAGQILKEKEYNLRAWWKIQEAMLNAPDHKMTLHGGPVRSHSEVDEFIVQQVEEALAKLKPLTTNQLVTLILQKWPNHHHKDNDTAAKRKKRIQQQIYSAMDENDFSLRRPTHVAQNAHVNMVVSIVLTITNLLTVLTTLQIVRNFTMDVYRRAIELGLPATHIVNMDETNVPFCPSARLVTAKTGEKSIPVDMPKSTGGTAASVCLAVTAAGKKLPPFVIFQGTPNGRIANSELPSLEASLGHRVRCTVQRKNWMDQQIMLEWIDRVLSPFRANLPGRILLLMDCLGCHMSERTREALDAIHCDVMFVPRHCTSKAQILDVGLNKPFKDHFLNSMLARSANLIGRPQVAEAIADAWEVIREESVVRTWKHVFLGQDVDVTHL